MRATAGRGEHHCGRRDVLACALLEQLNETGRVPQRTDGGAAADRNGVRLQSLIGELVGQCLARNFQFAPSDSQRRL